MINVNFTEKNMIPQFTYKLRRYYIFYINFFYITFVLLSNIYFL